MDKLYIVMPAYNEEANIEKVVSEWYKVLDFADTKSRFLIADSGSTDETHSILLNLQKKFDKIIILDNTLKQHGPKLIALYKYAVADKADYIFQTDSDGQTNPDEFKSFWDLRNDYDAILGNRVVRGDGFLRKIVENIVCILLHLYFGVKVKDSNAPFRLMSGKVLSKYIDRFSPDYNIPNIMLTTFFAYYNEKIMFKEISFKNRTAGKNSINLMKIIKIGIKAMKDFADFKRKM